MGRKPMTFEARQEMRVRILDGARAILPEEGLAGLSMRAIAKNVGASSMTLYLYFDDRNDIIQHLAKEGFELLAAKLEDINKSTELAEKCELLARIYGEFSMTHKHLFELMFSSTASTNNSLQQEGAKNILSIFHRTVGNSESVERIARLHIVHRRVGYLLPRNVCPANKAHWESIYVVY